MHVTNSLYQKCLLLQVLEEISSKAPVLLLTEQFLFFKKKIFFEEKP